MHTTYTGEIKHTKTGISTCLRLSPDIPNLEILSRDIDISPHTPAFCSLFLSIAFHCTTLVYLDINKYEYNRKEKHTSQEFEWL